MKKQHAVLATAALATFSLALVAGRPGQAAAPATPPRPEAARLLSQPDLATARKLAPGDQGATYYWLEGRARKVTVQFRDATAVTEREADGSISTRLTDKAGNDLATFQVSHLGSSTDTLEYRPRGRSAVVAARPLDVHATSAWAGRQAYQLWKDRVGDGSPALDWQGGLMRAAGSRRGGLDDDTEQIDTEWPDGVTAVVTKQAGPRRHVMTGAPITGHSITTRLQQGGRTIGTVVWFAEERVLAWKLPGISSGYLDDARLKKIGGWPFVPDMAWAGLQGFAFQYFHQQIAARAGVEGAGVGWAQRIAAFFVPRLLANEPGCDNLHWLDGTIFRYCCDLHDRCYETYGCSSSTWWRWWNSWTCDACNVGALFCFVDVGSPPYGMPYI